MSNEQKYRALKSFDGNFNRGKIISFGIFIDGLIKDRAIVPVATRKVYWFAKNMSDLSDRVIKPYNDLVGSDYYYRYNDGIKVLVGKHTFDCLLKAGLIIESEEVVEPYFKDEVLATEQQVTELIHGKPEIPLIDGHRYRLKCISATNKLIKHDIYQFVFKNKYFGDKYTSEYWMPERFKVLEDITESEETT